MAESTCLVKLMPEKKIEEIPLRNINASTNDAKKYLKQRFRQPEGPSILVDSKYFF